MVAERPPTEESLERAAKAPPLTEGPPEKGGKIIFLPFFGFIRIFSKLRRIWAYRILKRTPTSRK